MDTFDIKILNALQRDGRLTNTELADVIGLSPSQCHRRVKALEKAGVITGYRAVLSRQKVNLTLTAFITIRLATRVAQQVEDLQARVRQMPEVVNCYVVTGDHDLFLIVVLPDMPTFSEFMLKKIVPLTSIDQIRTSFVIMDVKPDGALPLHFLGDSATTPRP